MNCKYLFVFAFLFVSGFSFGQIKVYAPDGDTKIGDTGTTPFTKLHVTNNGHNEVAKFESDACAAQLLFDATGTGGWEWLFMSTADCASLGGGKFTIFEQNTAHRFVIARGGNVGIGTISPTAKLHVNGTIKHAGLSGPSDVRLKKNIKDLNYGLDEVLRMRPVTFNWNGRAGLNDTNTNVGILAQDLQKLIPEMVEEWVYVDDVEGSKSRSSDNHEEFLSIQSDAIQYLLINAIQEQQEIINKLQERVELLERQQQPKKVDIRN